MLVTSAAPLPAPALREDLYRIHDHREAMEVVKDIAGLGWKDRLRRKLRRSPFDN